MSCVSLDTASCRLSLYLDATVRGVFTLYIMYTSPRHLDVPSRPRRLSLRMSLEVT